MMSASMVTVILWIAALRSGLMAGVYFTFSGFVMKAFGKIESSKGIAAMNAINETILRSLFMPVFFGSSIVSVLLIIVALAQWGNADSVYMLIAGLVYFVGMFLCTVIFNVPLNNSLAELNENSSNVQQVWSHYLKAWTQRNHLRTVSSLLTCILSIWHLSAR